jgi:hypothetical protein
MVRWLMNDELEKIWKEAIVIYSKHHLANCLEGRRKTTRNLRHESKYHSQESNPASPKYNPRALPPHQPDQSLRNWYRLLNWPYQQPAIDPMLIQDFVD